MDNLIKNGDFSALGQYWKSEKTTYTNGMAHISQLGHIEQTVEIPSGIKAGTSVKVAFDISALYGNVSVWVNNVIHPVIVQPGHHEFDVVMNRDADALTLRFSTSNAFSLDNVEMSADIECTPVNVILNGDFTNNGNHWSGQNVTYSAGMAHVARIGHIMQNVNLPSVLKAGTSVQVHFDVSAMYGSSLTVRVNNVRYPQIKQEGHHEITLVIDKDSDALELAFTTTNAFSLDNVKLLVCL